MAINVANKIMGACIVQMMEQYKKRKEFVLEGVLFTKEEIIAWANELFPMRTKVKDSDMKPSSLLDNCLTIGSEDSLNEYYRLRCPDSDFVGLNETLLNEDVAKVLYRYLPNSFQNAEEFLNVYFRFINEQFFPLQERSETVAPHAAVWIAAATLTYNEYVRTQSTNLKRYTYRVRTIADLAGKYVTNPPSSGFNNLTGNTYTKDAASEPKKPFLISTNDKRRLAQIGEVDNNRPESLPLDFKVNTLKGIVPVSTLVEFVEKEYAAFLDNSTESLVAVTEPLEDNSVDRYGEGDFLKEVYMSVANYEKLAALIERKQNIVLQGAPGVGKSFCAKKLAYSIMGEKAEKRVQIVQFHQGYSYEDFVEGYRPTETGYVLKEGIFYNFCVKADEDREHKYFFIIDEMNRGNLSKIFGELFTLLEKGKRGEEIKLVYSGKSFSVPHNVYIIGLMNTADRSLAMIDYALRRRFGFFTMKPGFETDGFKEYKAKFASSQFDELIEQIKKLNEDIAKDDSLGEGFCIGHSFFCELDNNNLLTDLKSIVENEIIPLLEEYWFDERGNVSDWSEKLRSALG